MDCALCHAAIVGQSTCWAADPDRCYHAVCAGTLTRCHGCHLPVLDEQNPRTAGRKSFHPACYERADTCAICLEVITTSTIWRSKSGGPTTCAACGPATDCVGDCGRPVGRGRYACDACEKSHVTTNAEAKQLMADCMQKYREVERVFPRVAYAPGFDTALPIVLVPGRGIRPWTLPTDCPITTGTTHSAATSGGKKATKIAVLRGLMPTQLATVLAHELTHVRVIQLGLKMVHVDEEGLCELVSCIFVCLTDTSAQRRQRVCRIFENRASVYHRGVRTQLSRALAVAPRDTVLRAVLVEIDGIRDGVDSVRPRKA